MKKIMMAVAAAFLLSALAHAQITQSVIKVNWAAGTNSPDTSTGREAFVLQAKSPGISSEKITAPATGWYSLILPFNIDSSALPSNENWAVATITRNNRNIPTVLLNCFVIKQWFSQTLYFQATKGEEISFSVYLRAPDMKLLAAPAALNYIGEDYPVWRDTFEGDTLSTAFGWYAQRERYQRWQEGTCELGIDRTVAFSGKNSLSLKVQKPVDFWLASYHLPVEPGTEYLLTLYYRCSSSSSGKVFAGVEAWKGKDGKGLSVYSNPLLPKTSWQKLEVRLKTPPQNEDDYTQGPKTVRAEFGVRFAENDETPVVFWFDDISFQKVNSAAVPLASAESPLGFRPYFQVPRGIAKNYLRNSSFELGAREWMAMNLGEVDYLSVDESEHYFGSRSLCYTSKYPDVARVRPEGRNGGSIYLGHEEEDIEKSPSSVWRVGSYNHCYFLPDSVGSNITISVYAKAEKEGAFLEAGYVGDGTPIKKYYDQDLKRFPLSRDWKRYSATFTPRVKEVMAYLKFTGNGGRIWLDGIQAEDGQNATDYESFAPVELALKNIAPGNVFYKEETPEILLSLWNNSKQDEEILVRATARDFYDREFQVYEEKIKLGSAAHLDKRIALKLPDYGYYGVMFSAANSLGEISTGARIGVVRRPPELKPEESMFAAVLNAPDTYEYFAKWAPMARKIGVRMARITFDLGATYHQEKVQLAGYGRILEVLRAHGIETMTLPFSMSNVTKFILADGTKVGYTTNVYTAVAPNARGSERDVCDVINDPENSLYLKTIRNANKAIAQALRGKCHYYEILNEPDLSFRATTYFPILKASYEGIKEGDPEAKVVGASVTDITDSWKHGWLETLLKLGGGKYMDIMSVHLYIPAQKYAPYLAELDTLMKKTMGRTIPVWNTEDPAEPAQKTVDENTSLNRKFEFAVAEMGLRYTTSKAMGLNKFFYFLDLTSGLSKEHLRANGLFDWLAGERSVNPRGVAHATLAYLLDGAKSLGNADKSAQIHAYLFRHMDGRLFAAVWIDSADVAVDLVFSPGTANPTFMDIMGAEHKAVDNKVRLTHAPVFIFPATDNEDEFRDMLKKTVVAGQEFRLANVIADGIGTLKLEVDNLVSTPINPTVQVWIMGYGKEDWQKPGEEIQPFAVKRLALSYPAPTFRYDMDIAGSVIVQGDSGFKVEDAFYLRDPVPALAVTGDPKKELKDFYTLKMDRKEQLVLNNGGNSWGGPDDLSAELQFGWNDNHLFILCRVQDDVHHQPVGLGRDYFGDSLQIHIDPLCDTLTDRQGTMDMRAYTEAMEDDRAIIFSLTDDGTKHLRITKRYLDLSGNEFSDCKFESTRKGQITSYEIAIPWKTLGIEKPRAGQSLRFECSVNDSDGQGRDAQLASLGDERFYVLDHAAYYRNLVLVTPAMDRDVRELSMVEENLIAYCRSAGRGRLIPKKISKEFHAALADIFKDAKFKENRAISGVSAAGIFQKGEDVLLVVYSADGGRQRVQMEPEILKDGKAFDLRGGKVAIAVDSIPVHPYPYILRLRNVKPDRVKFVYVGGYGESFRIVTPPLPSLK